MRCVYFKLGHLFLLLFLCLISTMFYLEVPIIFKFYVSFSLLLSLTRNFTVQFTCSNMALSGLVFLMLTPHLPRPWVLVLEVKLRTILALPRSRDSVVSIATGYGLDDRWVGFRVPVGSRISSSPRRPDQLWDSSNLMKWVSGPLSPGVKRLGRETDHSAAASAEVKKMWIYTSTPPAPSWRS
jgi:hypothetical protein